MSIWRWLGEAAGSGAGAVGALIEWFGGAVAASADPATRRQVAFSVALIALAAKMAKADGVVTSHEVAAFRTLFAVPAGEERNVERLFDLARGDVAGFEAYAARIAGFYGEDRAGLEDVLDGLFAIARADGAIHAAELAYVERVATVFGFDAAGFGRIAARHVVPAEGDPYLVLGVDRGWPTSRIRSRYRALVAENHPDRAIARGLPADFVAIANDRMAAINGAWALIENERQRPGQPEG